MTSRGSLEGKGPESPAHPWCLARDVWKSGAPACGLSMRLDFLEHGGFEVVGLLTRWPRAPSMRVPEEKDGSYSAAYSFT